MYNAQFNFDLNTHYAAYYAYAMLPIKQEQFKCMASNAEFRLLTNFLRLFATFSTVILTAFAY